MGRDMSLVTLRQWGEPWPPSLKLLTRARTLSTVRGLEHACRVWGALRSLNWGGGEAPGAAPHPIPGPQGRFGPHPRLPRSDQQTRLHIWKACPSRPAHRPAHLEIPAPLRGNGDQPAPREEGAGGRQGRRAPIT